MAWGNRFFRRAALGRFCMVLLGLLSLGAVIISQWLTPLQQQRFNLTKDNHQKQRYIALLRLKNKSAEEPLRNNIHSDYVAFSVGDLTEQVAGRVIALRQEGRRTRLIWSLPWQSLPDLFMRLGAYHDVRLLAFSLEGKKDWILVSLSLEINNENS